MYVCSVLHSGRLRCRHVSATRTARSLARISGKAATRGRYRHRICGERLALFLRPRWASWTRRSFRLRAGRYRRARADADQAAPKPLPTRSGAPVTHMMASVTSVAEATLALEAGADIIDITDASRGPLAALDGRSARDIVETVGSFAATSAGIGEFPAMVPADIVAAVQSTSRLGVGYIRIGFWGTPEDGDCARAVSRLAASARLVAVLFADLPQATGLLDALALAGFSGVMYDTAEKRHAPLRLLKTETELALFVRRARHLGLLCGLAGRLAVQDVTPLMELRPDFLRFRGALCRAGDRTATLDPAALASVRSAMSGTSAPPAAARTGLRAR